jgi:hypothetical protein
MILIWAQRKRCLAVRYGHFPHGGTPKIIVDIPKNLYPLKKPSRPEGSDRWEGDFYDEFFIK